VTGGLCLHNTLKAASPTSYQLFISQVVTIKCNLQVARNRWKTGCHTMSGLCSQMVHNILEISFFVLFFWVFCAFQCHVEEE